MAYGQNVPSCEGWKWHKQNEKCYRVLPIFVHTFRIIKNYYNENSFIHHVQDFIEIVNQGVAVNIIYCSLLKISLNCIATSCIPFTLHICIWCRVVLRIQHANNSI